MTDINFLQIEKKWQEKWEKAKAFEVKESKNKKKYYVLEMFPYPSGSGLHMGHALNYTIGDIYARFKRMNGFNVLYPMGYDAFGLPAENAAIKAGEDPRKYTEKSVANFIKQQKALGLSYDWTRMIKTCDPDYYRWNQYFFLKFMQKGLVYRKKSAVNWCPKCDTVLANEQVHSGMCWRHEDTPVEIKHLEQWFIKTTDYADELLEDIKKLEWPERIKIMQENWIGKSFGSEINFEIPTNLNFVLLHGYTGSPEDVFLPWLKKELENRGYKVSVPKLPNTDNPDINEQVEYVLKNCKFDENTVLLGHSLGSVIALKVLEKLDKTIRKFISVAGFSKPGFKDKVRPFEKKFDGKFDFNKIKNNINEVVILRAKNDTAVPSDRADSLKEKIGGKIIDFVAEENHVCGKQEPEVLNSCLEKWPIFTTRADTIYGVTFMVISAQHPRLMELVTAGQKKEVEKFLKKIKSTSEKDIEELEKEGAFTGSYAINPINNEKIPVYVGNFVVADYGCGMVMAVPAHDERDFQFAKKYKIPIKVVINPDSYELNAEKMSRSYASDGKLANSDKLNGWNNREAISEIVKLLAKNKLGKETYNYKLRDWLISRQRYWGTPIPIVYCEKCGIVPIPEKDLPVLLPEKVKFGSGNPLASSKEFVETKCPKCKGKARRETDTMDTFFDSSWYFLRYTDNKNSKEAIDKKKIEYWMPVDQYIGGAEHACMHLIYARFFVKALRDLGMLKFDEPFIKLFNQGMLHGEDGFVMSKSRGNVVIPEEVSKKYGIDSARLFLVSIASPDKDVQWSEHGIEGSFKFLNRVIEYFGSYKSGKSSLRVESKVNKTIKEFSCDIENFRYNMAVIKVRSLFDTFSNEPVAKKDIESFLKMFSLFCPHVAEELWSGLGNKSFISLEKWPVCDEKKIDLKLEKQDELNENLVRDIGNILRIVKEKQGKDVSKVYVYTIPNELDNYREDYIKKRVNLEVHVFSAGDKNKYDPSGISKKSKPGKPGIFVE